MKNSFIKELGKYFSELFEKLMPDGSRITHGYWIPWEEDKNLENDFSHKEYTYLYFKKAPGEYIIQRIFRAILYRPNHNCYKFLSEVSSKMDVYDKQAFLYRVLEELEHIQFYYSRFHFFHYFFNNWKFVASAKVRAEHVRKLLNDVEKTISLLHLSIENTIQSNNTFQLENHINNDFTNLNLDHLINLVTSDGDEKIDINDLSKLMNWKTDQKGRILMTTKEFVVWSIIPIIMEYAEVKGEKENIYIKTLAKSINFKLGSIDSIKVTKSKAKDNENEKLYEVIDLFFRKIRRNMGK